MDRGRNSADRAVEREESDQSTSIWHTPGNRQATVIIVSPLAAGTVHVCAVGTTRHDGEAAFELLEAKLEAARRARRESEKNG